MLRQGWRWLGFVGLTVGLLGVAVAAQELPEANSQATPSPAAGVERPQDPLPQPIGQAPQPAAPATTSQAPSTTAPTAASGATTSAQAKPAAAGQSSNTNNNGAFVLGDEAAAQTQVAPPAAAPPAKKLPDPTPAQIAHIEDSFIKQERVFRNMLQLRYMYTETIDMELTDPGGDDTGQHYQQTNEIDYTPDGHREIICTYCPQPTIRDVVITENDVNDFFNMDMYTIDVDHLDNYTITYVDHEPLDQITAYRFRVEPKDAKKAGHNFAGTIWVDDRDLMIVKSYGKAPDVYDKKGEIKEFYPAFETWRQMVDGKYWFPVYTRADTSLPPSWTPGRMKMVVQFTNYKEFKATTRIIAVGETPPTVDENGNPITPAGSTTTAKPATTTAKPGGGGGGTGH